MKSHPTKEANAFFDDFRRRGLGLGEDENGNLACISKIEIPYKGCEINNGRYEPVPPLDRSYATIVTLSGDARADP